MITETELTPAEVDADLLLHTYFKGEMPRTLPGLHLPLRPVPTRSLRQRSYVALAASLLFLGCLTCLGTITTLAKPGSIVSGPLKDVPPTAKLNGARPPLYKPALPGPRP